MDNVKLIAKQIILNTKTIFSNKINILIVLFTLFISTMICVIFIPFQYGAGIPFTICTITISGVIYSTIDYGIRKSSLYDNIGLTKSNRWIFHLGSLLTIIIFIFFTTTILFLILDTFNSFGWLLVNWLKSQTVEHGVPMTGFYFTSQLYLFIIYCSFLISLLTFAISFAFQHLIKTQQGYFVLLLSVVILSIIFGGGLNDYWSIGSEEKEGINSRLEDGNHMFPWSLYWFSLIFPFYAPSQMIGEAAEAFQFTWDVNGDGTSLAYPYLAINGTVFSLLLFENQDWLWNLTTTMPYIEIVTLFSIGAVLSIFLKGKSK